MDLAVGRDQLIRRVVVNDTVDGHGQRLEVAGQRGVVGSFEKG